jgi:hypothetical protein
MRVVWRDEAVSLTVCPVLIVTPEARSWMELFERTHEVAAQGFGPALWRRMALPDAGGVEDQDAVTLAAMDFIRNVSNGLLLQERTKRRREKDETKTDDERRPRGRRRAGHDGR